MVILVKSHIHTYEFSLYFRLSAIFQQKCRTCDSTNMHIFPLSPYITPFPRSITASLTSCRVWILSFHEWLNKRYLRRNVSLSFLFPPSPAAARSLGISLNKLKRACRQYGIPRWPYRQVRSIRSTIQSLEKALEKCDSEIETASLKERLASLIKKEGLVCKFASCGENLARSVTLSDRFTHVKDVSCPTVLLEGFLLLPWMHYHPTRLPMRVTGLTGPLRNMLFSSKPESICDVLIKVGIVKIVRAHLA